MKRRVAEVKGAGMPDELLDVTVENSQSLYGVTCRLTTNLISLLSPWD